MFIGEDHRSKIKHLLQFFLGELRDPLTWSKTKGMSRYLTRALFDHQCGDSGPSMAKSAPVRIQAVAADALRELSALPG